jgi:hypothetical protein
MPPDVTDSKPDAPPPSQTAPIGSDVVDYTPKPPDAVRRAAKRANDLAAQFKADPSMAGGNNTGTIENPVQLSAPSVPGLAPAAPGQTQPELPLEPKGDTWEARYRTLQGKYDREIPQLRGQVGNLESLLATMRTVSPPAAPPTPLATQIPEEDVTAYGPELIDSARRWAAAELAPTVQDLRNQIEQLKGQQAKSAVEKTQDRVKIALDRDPELAPYWEQLDTDPNFIRWLQEIDEYSGVSRQVMLNHAYASGDAIRTGRFFKRYLHEHTVIPQSGNGAGPQTPPPNGYVEAGSVDLTNFAAPGRTPNATPGTGAPEQRIWARHDIQAFYDDRTKGRYRGREEYADRLERDIFAALNEGRIR